MKNQKKISFFNNQIYEKKSRYLKPKENFKFLIKILKKDKVKINSEIIDVGCSNGELLFNLNKNFKKCKLTGIDVDKNLIKKAKTMCSKDIIFKKITWEFIRKKEIVPNAIKDIFKIDFLIFKTKKKCFLFSFFFSGRSSNIKSWKRNRNNIWNRKSASFSKPFVHFESLFKTNYQIILKNEKT